MTLSNIILSIFTILILNSSQAQYNPQLLVPYFKKGKWGYSDTLGNIKIKPVYKDVSFFEKNRNDMNLAEVVLDNGMKSFVKPNGELLFSKKYGYLWDSYIYRADYLVIYSGKKFGLFSLEKQEIVLPVIYESVLYNKIGIFNIIFFKETGEATFKKLVNNNVLETEYVKLEFKNRYNEQNYEFENTKGEKGLITPQGIRIFKDENEYKIFKSNYELNNEVVEAISDDWKNAGFALKDKIELKNIYKNSVYEFKTLKKVTVKGKTGLVNERESIVLPIEYDEVKFSYSGDYAILKKDGKYGIKIFFTHYPTIEPKYDFIEKSKNIPVNKTWSFALMKIKMGDLTGYVGENGVEFFKK